MSRDYLRARKDIQKELYDKYGMECRNGEFFLIGPAAKHETRVFNGACFNAAGGYSSEEQADIDRLIAEHGRLSWRENLEHKKKMAERSGSCAGLTGGRRGSRVGKLKVGDVRNTLSGCSRNVFALCPSGAFDRVLMSVTGMRADGDGHVEMLVRTASGWNAAQKRMDGWGAKPSSMSAADFSKELRRLDIQDDAALFVSSDVAGPGGNVDFAAQGVEFWDDGMIVVVFGK